MHKCPGQVPDQEQAINLLWFPDTHIRSEIHDNHTYIQNNLGYWFFFKILIAPPLPSRKGEILIVFLSHNKEKEIVSWGTRELFNCWKGSEVQYNPSSRQAHLSPSAKTQGEFFILLRKFPLVQTSEEKKMEEFSGQALIS